MEICSSTITIDIETLGLGKLDRAQFCRVIKLPAVWVVETYYKPSSTFRSPYFITNQLGELASIYVGDYTHRHVLKHSS
jgi:hypothetical protein